MRRLSPAIAIAALLVVAGCATTGASRSTSSSSRKPAAFNRHVQMASVAPGVTKRGEGRALWIEPSLQPGQVFTVRDTSATTSTTHPKSDTEMGGTTEYKVESVDELGNVTLRVCHKRYWFRSPLMSFDSDQDPPSKGGMSGTRVGQPYHVVIDARGRCVDVPNGEEHMISWLTEGALDESTARQIVANVKSKGQRAWIRSFVNLLMISLPEPLPVGSQWVVAEGGASTLSSVQTDDKWRRRYTLDKFDAERAGITIDEVAATDFRIDTVDGVVNSQGWSTTRTEAVVDVTTGLIRRSSSQSTYQHNSGPGGYQGSTTSTRTLISGPE